MIEYKAILSLRISYAVLCIIRVLLLVSAFVFFYKTFGWLVFEKYQLGGNIRGLDPNVDKQLGLDKVTELSLSYEKAWIDAEVKFNNSIAIGSILCLLITFLFRPEVKPTDN